MYLIKPLKDFTDEELIFVIENNETIQIQLLAPICSEILRRMNNNKALLPEKKWEHKGPLC